MPQLKRNRISIIILLVVSLLFAPGCWDREELEDQAFVTTIGIDKGKDNQFYFTFRIAIPAKTGLGQTAGGGGGGNGESVAAQASLLTTVAAPNIPSAITLASSYINRDINLLHVKGIVFGETFARDGVEQALGILARFRELRRNIFMAVTQGEAHELIINNKPELEKSFTKWWEGVKLIQSQEALHPGTLFQEFVTDMEAVGKEGTMIYFAVNKKATGSVQEIEIPPSFRNGELGVKSGEIPRVGGNSVEYAGTAYFSGDKLKGVLDITETRFLQFLQGELRRSFYTVPDPLVKDRYIPLDIKLGSPPRTKVTIDNNKVIIKERLSLEADLVAIQSDINYASDLEKQRLLEKAIEANIMERCYALIKKLQNDGTDIIGYADIARRHFLTTQDWKDFNWSEKFKTAEVELVVNFEIRRTGMQGKPVMPTNK